MRIPEHYDVAGLLDELGLQGVDQREGEVFAICPEPSHDDTRAGSWSLNVVNGEHYCFACGFGGSLARLVALQRGMVFKTRGPDGERALNIEAAQEWLNERIDVLEGAAGRMAALLDELSGERPTRSEVIPMGEERLAVFDLPPVKELRKRRISAESAEKFGVLWDGKQHAWILPIRDHRGTLIGWQLKGRNIFRNHPPGVKKSECVFGLDCFAGDRAVMVESPLDAVRLDTAGEEGALSTYGAAWSHTQMGLILDVADELVVALDDDEAGRKAAAELLREYSRRVELRFLNYGDTGVKDPGDMENDDDIRWAVANARHAVRGKAAIGA